MNRLVGGTAILAALALLAIVATAFATPGSGVTSTTVAQGISADDIDVRVKTGDWKVRIDTKGPSTLAVSENRVGPGGHFGWHSHPGPSLVIVKSGTSTFYRGDDPDCTPHVHPAGTAYVDPGGVVHIARNESTTEELVVIVTRLSPAGVPPRNDEPDPGNCDF